MCKACDPTQQDIGGVDARHVHYDRGPEPVAAVCLPVVAQRGLILGTSSNVAENLQLIARKGLSICQIVRFVAQIIIEKQVVWPTPSGSTSFAKGCNSSRF